MKTQLQAVSLRIQTVRSNEQMMQSMKGATSLLGSMNRSMNLPALQRIAMDFERENDIMEQRQEMMDDAIDDVTGLDDDMESDEIVNQVLDEIGVEMNQTVSPISRSRTAVLANHSFPTPSLAKPPLESPPRTQSPKERSHRRLARTRWTMICRQDLIVSGVDVMCGCSFFSVPFLVLPYNWIPWRLRLFVILWVVTIGQLINTTHIRLSFFGGGFYLFWGEFSFREGGSCDRWRTSRDPLWEIGRFDA